MRSIDDAISTERIVISHDTDFGTLLAYRELSTPSFILIRSSDPVDVDDQARPIVASLDAMSDDWEAGAIAVFACGRLRIRWLSLRA
jgi:predicted nuclease of predicted toxin-antitoxin system